MKFAYSDLAEGQFEDLTVLISQQLLGMGVQPFATGPDGGRDGRFEGTAQLLPSQAARWTGKVVIQAKHTIGYNKTFGDSDFFSNTATTAVLSHEIERIRKLRLDGELDHYVLFSNRRLSAGMDTKIRRAIANACGISTESVVLIGIKGIEAYLKQFPHLADELPLTPMNSPMLITPDELAEAVEAIAEAWDVDGTFVAPEVRVPYDEKNAANGIDPEYAKAWRKRYLKDTAQIQAFLADPQNDRIRRLYEDAASEIDMKMLAHATDSDQYERVIEHIVDQLFSRDPDLSKNRRLTKSIVFFMYWSCDIGKTESSA